MNEFRTKARFRVWHVKVQASRRSQRQSHRVSVSQHRTAVHYAAATQVPYTDSGMAGSAEAVRDLATLDHVVEILEQLNMHHRVEVPKAVTATLAALGFEGAVGLSPSELLSRVLDKQRLLRRRAAAGASQNRPINQI